MGNAFRVAGGLGAIRAVENVVPNFYSMPDDPAGAVSTNRSNGLERTLETVEGMSRSRNDDVKTSVVLIAAHFARCHKSLLAVRLRELRC